MLPIVFGEIELVCIFLAIFFFFFSLSLSIGKRPTLAKIWGNGFFGPVEAQKITTLRCSRDAMFKIWYGCKH